MREARGPAWTDWLHDHGVVALCGIDTRSLVLHLRQAGACGRSPWPARPRSPRRWRASAPSPQMAGRALAAKVSAREPYVFSDAGRSANRGRRLRLQALDPEPARLVRRSGHGLPARRRRRRARPLRRRPALERPRRPGGPQRRDRNRPFAWSGASRSSGSASGTSCLRSPPGTRPSSSRSATAARTTRSSSAQPAACSSPARTTASRSSPSEAREATHVSLYDGTVEGLEYPELRARSVQFHPEAGPGPHDALGLVRRLDRGGGRPCQGGVTSSRSA